MSLTRITALTGGGALSLAGAAHQVYPDLLPSPEEEAIRRSRRLLVQLVP